MIFDIKISQNVTHKERLVASGYKNEPSELITYSSVVSIYIVYTIFIITALNDLDTYADNIGN